MAFKSLSLLSILYALQLVLVLQPLNALAVPLAKPPVKAAPRPQAKAPAPPAKPQARAIPPQGRPQARAAVAAPQAKGAAPQSKARADGGGFTTLTAAQVSSYKPYAWYASAAYCKPAATRQWTCGPRCQGNPSFKPLAADGDGSGTQYWFVGVDSALKTIIVAHQGTNPTKFMPVLTDAAFFPTRPDPALFPSLPADSKIHGGFATAHSKSAPAIRKALEEAIKKSGLKSVTLVGHSLGGAIALLNAVSLPQFFPGVKFVTKTFGQPRVGNDAFNKYVDGNVNLERITNKGDMVPTLPGRFVGFAHPKGEIHIQQDGSWITCPGSDNTDPRCTTGAVVNLVKGGSVMDHMGPYDGVTMDAFC